MGRKKALLPHSIIGRCFSLYRKSKRKHRSHGLHISEMELSHLYIFHSLVTYLRMSLTSKCVTVRGSFPLHVGQ